MRTGMDLVQIILCQSEIQQKQSSPLLKFQAALCDRVNGSTNVLVLVDGAFTTRSLTTITPEDIESIEVITNPSVEYDSDVANVINIVLKEERKKGLRLVTMANGTLPDQSDYLKLMADFEFSKFRLFADYYYLLLHINYLNYNVMLSLQLPIFVLLVIPHHLKYNIFYYLVFLVCLLKPFHMLPIILDLKNLLTYLFLVIFLHLDDLEVYFLIF